MGSSGPVLPAEDRTLSPITGYTRAHWISVADQLLVDAHRFASPSGARIVLPGKASSSGPDSDHLEGFARTFLLLAYRLAGSGGEVPAGLLQSYADGIAAGTDPQHAETWPAIAQKCRQTLVEACSLALGLHLTRPWLWDRLPPVVQERVVHWFQGVWGLEIPDNNWHMFRVVVGEFLASVGAAHDRAEMDADLARIEDFYVADGWYRDGGDARTADNFDHYCGWAMHHYPILWALMAGERGAARLPVFRERLVRFLEDFPVFFGADGAPVYQGRSLIYRFAAATAPWIGALADATPLAPGLTRRLASGALKHFVDRGFRDTHGIPTLGWYGPFPPMVQGYSGPGSPYWLSKAFAGLLLPEDHPCWTAVEEPLPVEGQDRVGALPAPGFLMSATHADGIVRLVNHGSDNHAPGRTSSDPHYARFAYSTATGPVLGAAGLSMADNHVGLVDPALGLSSRTRIHRLGVADHYAASWHRPVWPGEREQGNAGLRTPGARGADARIETASVVWGPWELRAHLVDAPARLTLHDSGWQVADDKPPRPDSGDRWAAAVTGSGLTSIFVSLSGHTAVTVAATENTSAFARWAAVSYAIGERAADRTVHVAVVGLTGGGPEQALVPSGMRCEVDGTTVTAQFPDGTWVLVALGEEAAHAPTLGGHRLAGPVRYARISPGERPAIVFDRPRGVRTRGGDG
ncbi:DUF2264 domain-containing protein [Streptomyces sp. 4503]|uniref:DUF2264 domain-containing protein n=1 Tax=Streptomyces niphimycinicus TaxID=2842201 RepID=A0ABS6CCA9_9ACTN|nr:DUF2264 domain-containing protein [Streptomyces niphimycinicus]MBU3864529.1 DUF2264 domain-containing protein [Streptomyces niphimycinicus]